MTIQISCSANPFVAQKVRKLLIKVPITLYAAFGLSGMCRVRVSLVSSSLGGLSIQAIPGTWNLQADGSVMSPQFNPNQLPNYSAYPAFFDATNPNAPTTGYSARYRVQVLNSLNVEQGWTEFDLTGDALPKQNANVAFVLDHGFGMNTLNAAGQTRLARVKAAFLRALPLLREEDTFGVGTFGNYKLTVNPQLSAGPATQARKDLATTLANNLTQDLSAPIKCIQIGLDAGRAVSPTGTVILLTDGTNINAPGHVLVQPTLPTSALIIGEDPNQIPASASTMVSPPPVGHYAFASQQTLGEFAIEKLLTQVLIGLGGSTYISDPEGSLAPGGSQTFPIHITEADHDLDVIIFSNDAKALRVKVELPIVDEQGERCGHVKLPEVKPLVGDGYLMLRLALPALVHEGNVFSEVTVSRSGDASLSCDPPVRFNLLVAARTDLKLETQITSSGSSVGSDVFFSATLLEYGLPWAREGVTVHVELTYPDGGTETLCLDECAPGRFQKSLRSVLAGSYTAHFVAVGKSLVFGREFRRESLRTIATFPASDCCAPKDPCPVYS